MTAISWSVALQPVETSRNAMERLKTREPGVTRPGGVPLLVSTSSSRKRVAVLVDLSSAIVPEGQISMQALHPMHNPLSRVTIPLPSASSTVIALVGHTPAHRAQLFPGQGCPVSLAIP